MMQESIQRAARDLAESNVAVALTGAGISVESGIPPFRGKGGVWEKIDPYYAHIDMFNQNPAMVWEVLIKNMKEIIDQAKPNDGHKGLARLDEMGILKTIITQNVDGLHQLAGNRDVIEFHGSFAWQRCTVCEKKIETSKIHMDTLPPQCECGGIYRPDCVFFGEMIPLNHLIRSKDLAAQCDVMLVVGTSAVVHPAASLPMIAKHHGAKVIEINLDPTELTHSISDYLIQGKAGDIMNALIPEVEKQTASRKDNTQ